jgi:hypothetical protein
VVFSVTDDAGAAYLDSIPVLAPTAVAEFRPRVLRAEHDARRGVVRFAWEGGAPAPTDVTVADVRGRIVARVPVERGAESAGWRARVPAGIYVATLPGAGCARIVLLP